MIDFAKLAQLIMSAEVEPEDALRACYDRGVADGKRPLEQWPVQLDANGVMHLAKDERQSAKVIPFRRPPPDEPTPPSGGTPIASAA